MQTGCNPNEAGSWRVRGVPLHDFSNCSGMHMDDAPPLTDFSLSKLAHLLKFFFWKSDVQLQSHMTFRLCMSARKSLIFVICVQNIYPGLIRVNKRNTPSKYSYSLKVTMFEVISLCTPNHIVNLLRGFNRFLD